MDEILQIVRRDPSLLAGIETNNGEYSIEDGNPLGTFDIFDICDYLAGGELDERQIAVLRKGFEALLNAS